MSFVFPELLRKLIHLLELPVIIGYALLRFYFSQQVALIGLTALLLILIKIEYFRVDYETRIGTWVTDFLIKLRILREHERSNVTSAIYFVISTIIVFSAFEYRIALLALLLTVFGDLAASLSGMAFGTKKIFRRKSYIGTLTGFMVNIIVGIAIMPNEPVIFLPMAVFASIVETITQKLNDNLTVPLFAGFVGQLIVFLNSVI